MFSFLTNLAAVPAAILALSTARRWLFLVSALLPQRPAPPSGALPALLLVVPFHNERLALPGLLAALSALDYPANRLRIVFVDDGSSDAGASLIPAWLAGRPNAALLRLVRRQGKAAALNAALAHCPDGEGVAVYDADDRPTAGALKQLARYLGDPTVGLVSGRRAASNPLVSAVASHGAFEQLVHQVITMRAKDRLALAPASLGSNCLYRRVALEGVGGFRSGALLEDSELTLRLARAGWQSRFAPQALSYHAVPDTPAGYWRQHLRWQRGFDQARQSPAPVAGRRLPFALRLELLAFSLGYADRLAFLLALALFLARRGRRLLAITLAASLVTPFLQVVAALRLAREPAIMWRRLPYLPLFFPLDMAVSAVAAWMRLRGVMPAWEERRYGGE
jgi:cellulose synthase/poly-beta-1,6-N-acetylglucosamine synthase-like glycosyltransferase